MVFQLFYAVGMIDNIFTIQVCNVCNEWECKSIWDSSGTLLRARKMYFMYVLTRISK